MRVSWGAFFLFCTVLDETAISTSARGNATYATYLSPFCAGNSSNSLNWLTMLTGTAYRGNLDQTAPPYI